jgi:hypothetical protein
MAKKLNVNLVSNDISVSHRLPSAKGVFTCYNFPVVSFVGYEDFSIPYRG